MTDFYDDIATWLNDEALTENEFGVTLKAFAQRLLDGGVPIARINVGRMILHPAIGLTDAVWEADSGLVRTSVIDRSDVTPTLGKHTPFGDMSKERYDKIHANLENREDRAEYKIFDDLAARGYTGYVAFTRPFGQKQHVFEGVTEDFRGTAMSFSTRRAGGFASDEIAGLERLATPLAVCLRVQSDKFLTLELLSHYLGRATGEKVYAGQNARGQGDRIECVLFYSDMRNSMDIAGSLEPEEFLAVINRFFDCTAAAVLDHGGEVLKFIGDGVLAIFPIIEGRRPGPNMCRAALAAARDAFARAQRSNIDLRGSRPAIEFGVALHVGEVIYGNVGTAKRHDFTATGPAVGIASRIEALTRPLDAPLLASAEFATLCSEKGTVMPPQDIKGTTKRIQLYRYDPIPVSK